MPDVFGPTFIRTAGRMTSLRAGRRRLAILFYHRILAQPDPMYPDVPAVDVFATHMKALRDSFNVVGLADAVEMLGEGCLPPRAVAITFDDGFADNYHVALPVLRRLRLEATVFIASDFIDGGCMFNDAVIEACRHAPLHGWRTGIAEIGDVDIGSEPRRAVVAGELVQRIRYLEPVLRNDYAARLLRSAGARQPANLMMSGDEVVALGRAGIEIGAHTASHPILARLGAAEAEGEIVSGREALAQLTGRSIRLFAYPNGKPGIDFTVRDVETVRRQGFAGAVTTAWGCPDRSVDRFELPRIGCWGETPMRFSMRLLWYFSRGMATAGGTAQPAGIRDRQDGGTTKQ